MFWIKFGFDSSDMYGYVVFHCIAVKWKIWVLMTPTFVITGGTSGCHYDNHWCHQWWKSWHGDDSVFSEKESWYGGPIRHHRWHQWLSWRQPLVPPVMTKLAWRQLCVFREGILMWWPHSSSLVAPVVVKTTIAGATSDDKVGMETTLCFQRRNPDVVAPFVITGGTSGCQNDNRWCHQWWQSWHGENSMLSEKESWRGGPILFLPGHVHTPNPVVSPDTQPTGHIRVELF